MLAIIATLVFLADLIGLEFDNVNMTTLGLLFVAAHLAFGSYVPNFGRRSRSDV